MWSAREAIEVFHLLFLRAFSARADMALYALKGGCNLRFFHKSVRYSEDMGLDIRTMPVAPLRNNVHRVPEAAPFLTRLGVVSFHRLPPELFSGFEVQDAGAPRSLPPRRR